MSEYGWITTSDGRRIYRRLDPRPAPARSHLSRPHIRPDGMESTWNPVDGNRYESRSAYERAVKEAGCEIVGDDPGHWGSADESREYQPEGLKEDIKQAWDQLSG